MGFMDSTFLTACVALITLGIWVGIGFHIYTLIQVRRAALAVEMLSYELGDGLERMQDASGKLFDFATNVRSGWMRAFEVMMGAAAALWTERRRSEEPESHSGSRSKAASNEHDEN